jgi:DNA-binding CsgD family transcriptional regulator
MDRIDEDDHVNKEFKEWIQLMKNVKINKHVGDYLASAAPSLDILTSNHIAAFIFDYSNGNYSYMNEYFVRLMGKTREQILSVGVRIMQELVHPEDFLKCLNITRKIILEFGLMDEKEKESIHFRFFYRLKRTAGEYMWVMQSNRHLLTEKNGLPIDIAFILEMFNPQHQLKVMGVLETQNRNTEIFPDGEMDLLNLLSQREMEILQLIRQGLTTAEISTKLTITVNTVKAHRQNILNKLNVRNMVQAIGYLEKLV